MKVAICCLPLRWTRQFLIHFDVAVRFSNNTATGGSDSPADFVNTAQTLSFVGLAAESHQISVATIDDDVVEGSESFRVILDASAPGINDSDIGTLSIIDNDTASLVIEDASSTEGSDLKFAVTLDKAVQGGLVVNVELADGTATGGAAPLAIPADYDSSARTVSFAGTVGETQIVTVSTRGDSLAEPDETFTLSLAANRTDVDDSDAATGTILDNRPVVIGGAALSATEGSAIGTVLGTVDASDADGDPLTYRLLVNANPNRNFVDAVRIDSATGEIIVTDPSDFDFELAAQLQLTVQVTERAPGATIRTAAAVIVVNVTNGNEAPRIGSIAPVRTGSPSVSIPITGSDPDNGQSFETSTSFQLLSLQTTSVTPLQKTIFEAKLAIEDGNLFFNEFGGDEKWLVSTRTGAWFFILPDSRIFEWDLQRGVLSGTLVGQLAPSVYADPALIIADTLGGPLPKPQDVPIPASQAPTGSVSGNVLTVDSNGFLGSVEATIRATDPGGLSDEATIQIEFIRANQAPVIAPIGDRMSAAGASEIIVPLDVSDPDGDAPLKLTARLVGPIPASVRIEEGVLTIRTNNRNAAFFGVFDVIVTATDGRGGKTEQTFQARFIQTAALFATALSAPDNLAVDSSRLSRSPADSGDGATGSEGVVPPLEVYFDFDPDGLVDVLDNAEWAELNQALRTDIWGDDSLLRGIPS